MRFAIGRTSLIVLMQALSTEANERLFSTFSAQIPPNSVHGPTSGVLSERRPRQNSQSAETVGRMGILAATNEHFALMARESTRKVPTLGPSDERSARRGVTVLRRRRVQAVLAGRCCAVLLGEGNTLAHDS